MTADAPRPRGLTALAAAVLARPWTGAAWVAGTGLVALLPWRVAALLPLTPVALVACAGLVALLVLELGVRARPAAAGAAGILIAGALLGAAGPALVLVGLGLLPVVCGAAVLRALRALSLALLCLAGFALLALLGSSVGLDAAALARRQAAYGQALALVYPEGLPAGAEPLLKAMVRLAGGIFAVTLLALWAGALCLGRSLQARVRAPGAFAAEFRALRLGRWVALAILGVMIMAAVTGLRGTALWAQLAVLGVGLGSLQGLAVLHGAVALRALWGGTLWFAYGGLALAAMQTGALLAVLGIADNWLDLRGRLARRAGGSTGRG